MTKPPPCWVRWRGKPASSPAIFERQRERRIGGIEAGGARTRSSPIGVEPWPQAVPFSAVITSSERPKTLAVSRIAERVR